MDIGFSALRNLMTLKDNRRKRISSFDRSGGNDDRYHVQAGETLKIADIKGPGAITHIWMTLSSLEKFFLKKAVLRVYWDNEKNPSIEVPIGDLFGAGHNITENFISLPIQMSPEDGKGFNLWFPMPFENRAVFEVENQNIAQELLLYFYIDYEIWPTFPENMARFHAQWRRSEYKVKNESETIKKLLPSGLPASVIKSPMFSNNPALSNYLFQFEGSNLTGEDNYVILEAEGKGHYVGNFLYIHNMREIGDTIDNWYGEGDDMIFIDGEKWPPSLHGTGTEDYFNMAWCPTQKYSGPYHGLILPGGRNWKGKITLYRFHIEDPIYFNKSIKVTIEHGHNNNRYDEIFSVAFWYQREPHKKFPSLPNVRERLPLAD